MKKFAFSYISAGTIVTGIIIASSRSAAIADLKGDSEGIVILSIAEMA